MTGTTQKINGMNRGRIQKTSRMSKRVNWRWEISPVILNARASRLFPGWVVSMTSYLGQGKVVKISRIVDAGMVPFSR